MDRHSKYMIYGISGLTWWPLLLVLVYPMLSSPHQSS